jgi:hypothetical protein
MTNTNFSLTLTSDEPFATEALAAALEAQLRTLRDRNDLASRSQARATRDFLRQLNAAAEG